MGNCMETHSVMHKEAGETEQRQHKLVKEDSKGKKGVRVKVVVTKEELQWLILELSQKKRIGLEQVLQQIQRSRAKVEGWRPSLDTILEIPELSDMDT